MSSTLKQSLHLLLDALPDEELPAARRFLEFLHDQGSDPYTHLDAEDDLDDEDRERLHASIRRSLEQQEAGKGRPASEVIAELRARG
jgi:hypothetical protein